MVSVHNHLLSFIPNIHPPNTLTSVSSPMEHPPINSSSIGWKFERGTSPHHDVRRRHADNVICEFSPTEGLRNWQRDVTANLKRCDASGGRERELTVLHPNRWRSMGVWVMTMGQPWRGGRENYWGIVNEIPMNVKFFSSSQEILFVNVKWFDPGRFECVLVNFCEWKFRNCEQ